MTARDLVLAALLGLAAWIVMVGGLALCWALLSSAPAAGDLGGGDFGGGMFNYQATPTPLMGCCACPGGAPCTLPNPDWTCGGGCAFVRDAICAPP